MWKVVLVLAIAGVWLTIERHNALDAKGQLETKLASSQRRESDAIKKVAALEAQVSEFRAKAQEAEQTSADLASQLAQASRPAPVTVSPPPPEKTWLQQRIEQGNSLNPPPPQPASRARVIPGR